MLLEIRVKEVFHQPFIHTGSHLILQLIDKLLTWRYKVPLQNLQTPCTWECDQGALWVVLGIQAEQNSGPPAAQLHGRQTTDL